MDRLFSFSSQGWQCPKCNRIFSPFTQECLYCNKKEISTVAIGLDDISDKVKDKDLKNKQQTKDEK